MDNLLSTFPILYPLIIIRVIIIVIGTVARREEIKNKQVYRTEAIHDDLKSRV